MWRLWHYFGLYFLKPFDAVNDSLTSDILLKLDWDGGVVELGSGDGEFSYVMHGGSFPIWYDRYLDTNLSKQDMFDTHTDGKLKISKKLSYPNIILAIDARENHVKKILEIGFAKSALCSAYESLPLPDASVEKIFYYTPHGLNSHEDSINEAIRVLEPKGKMLILLYDSVFKDAFVCKRLSERISNKTISDYFRRLDNGRYDEITNLSRSKEEWLEYFGSKGLRCVDNHTGLSTFAWRCYDIQTRPVLRWLIRLFNFFPLWARTILKTIWMLSWFPFLVIFYLLFSNQYLKISKNSCYFSFELEKVD